MESLYYLIVFLVAILIIFAGTYCDKRKWKVAKIVCWILLFLLILLFL